MTIKHAMKDVDNQSFSWSLFWTYAGPGWLMSMAYLDPGNLEADLQNGAYTGYQLIWILFLSTCAGFFLQVLAARLGTVTGKHLAQLCAQEYSSIESTMLWLLTEIAIIGSDIQEIIGSAIAFKMLFGLPLWMGCLLTGFDTFTFFFLHYIGVRALEAFFSILIGTMCICFFIDFSIGNPDPVKILFGFVPRLEDHAIVQAVGTVGAILMPHNVFLHSALVQSRRIDRSDRRKLREANKYFAIESGVALFVSFCINLAVIAVFAKGFYFAPCTSLPPVQTACVPFDLAVHSGNTIYNYKDGSECAILNGTIEDDCPRCSSRGGVCQQMSLYDAGDAISGVLGQYAKTVWAVGLLAAGQASTMTGTYAGQFVMEGFWTIRLSPWKRMLMTRSLALIPALLIAVISKSNITRSDKFDEWLNVLQSIQLPFALLPLLSFTNNRKIMGGFANSGKMKLMAMLITVLLLIINIYIALRFLVDISVQQSSSWNAIAFAMISGMLYLGFMFQLVRKLPQGSFTCFGASSWKSDVEEELCKELIDPTNPE